jgi:hypothetical protein
MAKAPPLEMVCDGTELYLKFNGVKIARRQNHTWVSLEPGYRVLDTKNKRGKFVGIVVELNGVRVH